MRTLFAAAAFLLGLAAAQAQPNVNAKPGADEIAAVKTCIAQAIRDKTGVPGCAGTAVNLCVDRQLEETVFDCQIRELAIWDGMLNDDYGQVERGLDPKGAAQLRDIERAWIAYVDKSCMLGYALMGSGSTGALKWEYGCRIDATARRMAELWGLRDWLAERRRLTGAPTKHCESRTQRKTSGNRVGSTSARRRFVKCGNTFLPLPRAGAITICGACILRCKHG